MIMEHRSLRQQNLIVFDGEVLPSEFVLGLQKCAHQLVAIGRLMNVGVMMFGRSCPLGEETWRILL